MNFVCGGKVEKADKREDKQEVIDIDTTSALFKDLTPRSAPR